MVRLVVADFWLWTTGRRFGAVGAGVERGVLGGRVARKTESSRQGGGFSGDMEVRMRIEVIMGWEVEVVRWGGIAVWLGGWVGLVVVGLRVGCFCWCCGCWLWLSAFVRSGVAAFYVGGSA